MKPRVLPVSHDCPSCLVASCVGGERSGPVTSRRADGACKREGQRRSDVSAPAKEKQPPTFEWREASVEDQLQVAQLSLSENNRGELLRFLCQFFAPGRVACDEVLQNTACDSWLANAPRPLCQLPTMWSVRHCVVMQSC
jgi:hypothetical protein